MTKCCSHTIVFILKFISAYIVVNLLIGACASIIMIDRSFVVNSAFIWSKASVMPLYIIFFRSASALIAIVYACCELKNHIFKKEVFQYEE